MPRTPRSVRRSSSGNASSSSQQQQQQQKRGGATTEPRLAQMEEDHEHDRLTANHHRHLVREKLENLRLLVKEIQDDDWCFDRKERLPSHVTKSLAWKPAAASSTGTSTKPGLR